MTLLEIEQKFSYRLSDIPRFRTNTGTPSFHRLKFLKPGAFEDIYYDTRSTLSNAGLWVRKRDYDWQAKQRVSGTYTRSTFQEFSDPEIIHRMIRKYFPDSPGPEQNFGLNTLCCFRTCRETAIADEKFTVVLDKTNFGHTVGEVEMLSEEAENSHAEITAFMEKYSWFFDRQRPKGKVTAYFEKYGMPLGRKPHTKSRGNYENIGLS